MDKLPVKQVNGAVDLTTNQRIEASKSFLELVVSQEIVNGPFIKIDGNFIYWLKHADILEEIGNMRIGVSHGGFLMQSFQDVWVNV